MKDENKSKEQLIAELAELRCRVVELEGRDEQGSAQKYLDIAGVMIVVLNAAAKISLINEKGCEILGYAKEEIIGKDWIANFLPERVRADVRNVFENIMAGREELFKKVEEAVLISGGEERIISWHNTVLKDENDRIIGTLSSGEDITARLKAERALRESEERFRSLIESSSEHIFMLDREGVYLNSNSHVEHVGLERGEDLVGRYLRDVYPPEVARYYLRNLEQVLVTGQAVHFEHPLPSREGLRYHLDTLYPIFRDDEVWAVGGICRDITERKRAEDKMEWLARFPSENPYPVLRIAEDGKIIYANSAGAPLLDLWRVRTDEYLPDYWREFVGETLSSGVSKETEVRYHDRVFALTFAPVVEGKYVNLYGLDITKRKRARMALRESEELFRSSNSHYGRFYVTHPYSKSEIGQGRPI